MDFNLSVSTRNADNAIVNDATRRPRQRQRPGTDRGRGRGRIHRGHVTRSVRVLGLMFLPSWNCGYVHSEADLTICQRNYSLAQLVRARGCRPQGHRFNPRLEELEWCSLSAPVAQWIEHETSNLVVGISIIPWGEQFKTV